MTDAPRAASPGAPLTARNNAPWDRFWSPLSVALLGFGLLVRAVQYAHPNSLWFDEARNAIEILKPSWLLMLPPHVEQPTPVGFLLLERGVVAVLGEGEWALRLLPFAAGLAALALGAHLAQRSLRGVAVPLAVGMLALSGPAIYFGSELKQYSTDLLVFLVLVSLLLRANEAPRLSPARLGALALFGAASLWLSYTSVFVLAAGGTWLLCKRLHAGERRDAAGLLAVGIAWLVSFGFHYHFVIAHWSSADWLTRHWQGSFPPLGSSPAQTLAWLFGAVVETFRDPLGLGGPRLSAAGHAGPWAGVAVWTAFAFFALGCVRTLRERPPLLLLFLQTFALVLVFGCLRLYPFDGRLLLFLVPVLAFLTASGVEGLLGRGKRVALALAIAVALLAQPAAMATSIVFGEPLHGSGRVNLPGYEGIRWVIPYLKSRWQEGDVIYLYHGALPEYAYYARRQGFRAPVQEGVRASGQRQRYREELEALGGEPRVWVVFAHAGPGEHRFFLRELDAMGTRIDGIERPLADAHLYDLSRARRREPASNAP